MKNSQNVTNITKLYYSDPILFRSYLIQILSYSDPILFRSYLIQILSYSDPILFRSYLISCAVNLLIC